MLKLRTQSLRRYRIVGRLPSIYGEEFAARLKDRAFQPLGADDTRAYGWVTADNLLMTEFDVDTLIRGEQACFSLRVDRRRVNPRLLRAHVDLEIRARRLAAQDDDARSRGTRDGGTQAGPFRVSRDERRELRDGLERELLRHAPPSLDAFPVLIHPKRRLCTVLSLHSQAKELVPLLFQDTFDAHLVALTPWTRGQELLVGDGGDEALQALHRSDFAVVSARTRPEGPGPEATRPAQTRMDGTAVEEVS